MRDALFPLRLHPYAAELPLLARALNHNPIFMNISFGRDGAVIGEYSEEQVPALLKSNALLRSDLFWHEGMPDWQPVDSRWPSLTEPLKVDARAEIVWGRDPQEVLTMLQRKGVGEHEAIAFVEELMAERAESIRGEGIRKSIFGALFTLAPIAYYFFTVWIGDMSIKLFAALIVLGAYGIGKLTNGLKMVFRPRTITASLASAV